MRLQRVGFALAVAAIAAAALWWTLVPTWRERPGTPAPSVTLALLGGGQLRLVQLRGQRVLIDFWSPDCAPCVAELPRLELLAREAHGKLTVIGVAMAYADPDAGRAVAARAGITYPLVWDRDGRIAAAFGGIHAIPTQVLISADGRIMARTEGSLATPLLAELQHSESAPQGGR